MKIIIPILFIISLTFGDTYPSKLNGDGSHITVSMLVVVLTNELLFKDFGFRNKKTERVLLSFTFGLAVGVSKELYDLRSGGKFSGKDIVLDVIGSGMGLVFISSF